MLIAAIAWVLAESTTLRLAWLLVLLGLTLRLLLVLLGLTLRLLLVLLALRLLVLLTLRLLVLLTLRLLVLLALLLMLLLGLALRLLSLMLLPLLVSALVVSHAIMILIVSVCLACFEPQYQNEGSQPGPDRVASSSPKGCVHEFLLDPYPELFDCGHTRF
jgi:hypothetical protein